MVPFPCWLAVCGKQTPNANKLEFSVTPLRGMLSAQAHGLRRLPMPRKKDPAAVELGRRGGKKIAKRGSEYFRKLQAKRRNRKGGRPPKRGR